MGKIDDARNVIGSSPEDMSRLDEQVMVELFARDFVRASQLLSQGNSSGKQTPEGAVLAGIIARAQGDVAKATSSFQLARDRALRTLDERPNDPESISRLSVADAGLGRKDEAVREAKRAVELCPMSQDAIDGAYYETMLAVAYAWTGERDAALSILEKMVRLPRSQNWGELRFSPLWDDVRKDARFEQLITQAALPPAYD